MSSITFAEYAAQAEDRKKNEDDVLKFTEALCEVLTQNYIDQAIAMHLIRIDSGNSIDYHKNKIQELKSGNCNYKFCFEPGRKYYKVIMNANGLRSSHCFVDKKSGDVYKSASWNSPAKGVRFNLLNDSDREWLYKNANWEGGYLYKK